MGGHIVDIHHLVAQQTSNWIQLILGTPVVLWAGWPFFTRAVASVKNRSLNMFTLIALGTGAAWLYSMVATLAPGLFPDALRSEDRSVAVYFEAAAVITVLVLLGQVLELREREKTSGAIKALLGLAPKTAVKVKPDGADETVQVDTIQVADLLRVRPGEKVPVDGVLTEGRGNVDESMVTGEPIPVAKTAGSKLTVGTMNQTGGFVMRAEKVGADTLLSQIVHMVAAAQRSRAPIQRMADRVAGWFVPVVMLVAALTFVIWLAWGPAPAFSYALITAVAVLIIACPCALGLATPMSIMVGVGKGAQHGVLIRDAEALERMEKIDTLVLDKTGTLTEGRPKVVHIEPANGFKGEAVLQKLASVERASEHPLAMAIVMDAQARKLPLSPVTDFDSPVGKGVVGTVDGQLIEALRAAGIRIVMLTGDGRTTAEAVGRQLHIDEVIAEVSLGGRRGRSHGDRHRRRDGERGHHAAQGRPDGHRSREDAVPCNDAEHSAEPVPELCLQRRRHPPCRRGSVPVLRAAAFAGGSRRCHGALIGERHHERLAAAHAEVGLRKKPIAHQQTMRSVWPKPLE